MKYDRIRSAKAEKFFVSGITSTNRSTLAYRPINGVVALATLPPDHDVTSGMSATSINRHPHRHADYSSIGQPNPHYAFVIPPRY